MNVHMLKKLKRVHDKFREIFSKFNLYADSNLNALPGIWTVLTGNVRRRNAVEKVPFLAGLVVL